MIVRAAVPRGGMTDVRSVLGKVGRAGVGGPVRAVVGVPVGSTALERRALVEAAEEAGVHPAGG